MVSASATPPPKSSTPSSPMLAITSSALRLMRRSPSATLSVGGRELRAALLAHPAWLTRAVYTPSGGTTRPPLPKGLSGISVSQFSELRRETVRTGSEEPAVWPKGPPKRYFSAHFGLPTPPISTLRALLVPLSGQFQKVHRSRPVSTILNMVLTPSSPLLVPSFPSVYLRSTLSLSQSSYFRPSRSCSSVTRALPLRPTFQDFIFPTLM